MTNQSHTELAARLRAHAEELNDAPVEYGQHTGRKLASLLLESAAALESPTPPERVQGVRYAALSVVKHWCEFGPEAGFDEVVDQLTRALDLSATPPPQAATAGADIDEWHDLAKQAADALMVFNGHDSGANLEHRYGKKWWEPIRELESKLRSFAALRASTPAERVPPSPCPTCEALARTVMLDQTGKA